MQVRRPVPIRRPVLALLLVGALLLSATAAAAAPPVEKATGDATITFFDYEFPDTGALNADFVAMRDTNGKLKGEVTIDPYPVWTPTGSAPVECLFTDGNEAWIGMPYWCEWCNHYHGLYLYVEDNGEGVNAPDDMMALYSFSYDRPSVWNGCDSPSFRDYVKGMAVPIIDGNIQLHE